MKKKMIALMLIIPLLLILTTFSIANVVVIAVPIPVSGIKLNMDDVEYLNLAEGGVLDIDAEVLPSNAKNRGVAYRVDALQGKTLANVSVKDGVLHAHSTGSAKIVVETNDGGYKASFLLEVDSDAATHFAFAQQQISVKVGEKVANDATVEPLGASDKNIVYTSSNPKIATVEALSGKVLGLAPGEVTVYATLQNGMAEGEGGWSTAPLSGSFTVVVTEQPDADIAINGKTERDLTEYAEDGVVQMTLGVKKALLSANAAAHNAEARTTQFVDDLKRVMTLTNAELANDPIVLADSSDKVYFDIVAVATEKSAQLEVGGTTVNIKPSDQLDALEIQLVKDQLFEGEVLRILAQTLPRKPKDVVVTAESSDPEVFSVTKENGFFTVLGKKEGVAQLTVTAIASGVEKSATVTLTVGAKPLNLNFVLSAKTWGVKERFAYASHQYKNGVEQSSMLSLELTANVPIDYSKVTFEVSDSTIATLNGRRLSVLKSGTVTITATSTSAIAAGYADHGSAVLTIDCVAGINVDSYEGLMYASRAGKKIALQQDVMLLHDLTGLDRAQQNAALAGALSTMDTTADWSYYKNRGQNPLTDPPKIKYAVEFKADVFGNGYALNAHHITAAKDAAGALLDEGFTGPLSMVEVNFSTAFSAAVRAQDNIVFLVRADNVRIDNVELLSRNLTPNDKGMVELNDLNYAGTTLEVMGDEVKIANSRVKNGRTAVRIYGKQNSPDAPAVTVDIESCVLSFAREFILKIGSNTVTASTQTTLQPLLSYENKTYKPRDDNNFNDPNFVNRFVKTTVNLKNSALIMSGIFSVGIECKFGGTAFMPNVGSYYFPEWRDASGTMYPARLNLIGEVGLYDWKNIKDIDASTLIETKGTGDLPFTFDIAKILEQVASKDPFKELLLTDGAETYAHGGIAFYGGGVNYSTVDTQRIVSGSYLSDLRQIEAKLSIVPNMNLLVQAAGEEPFRFLMFDNAGRMGYRKQQELLQSGGAYAFITPAI